MAQANYTEQMTSKMVATYTANPTRATVDALAKELERIAERKRKWKQFDWMHLIKHPLTWILLMTLVAGLLGR